MRPLLQSSDSYKRKACKKTRIIYTIHTFGVSLDSNNPIGASAMSHFKLPNSKYTGSVAFEYFIRPNRAKGKFQMPDYWVENSVEDIIKGRDICFEKAKEIKKE